jgi:hypothetical protein
MTNFLHMTKRFSLLIAFSLLLMPFAGIRAASMRTGDLIKASGPAVYYYRSDGKRLVFPNEKTYFSWYDDFSGVKTISDAELASLMIGGNVTYRPGKYLVKITTNPKVYAVDANGTLRWIETEAVARVLYGTAWASKVHDIPDTFFLNYREGSSIASASDYDASAVLAANLTIDPTAPAPEQNSSNPGNPSAACSVPAEAQAQDVSNPTTVVGNGTPSSCTAAAFESAVQNGGIVTFNCGPNPVTITLDHEIRLLNKAGPDKNGYRVIDGGGLVTLSGGGKNRILYQDGCAQELGWLNTHCQNSLYPRLVVQNLTFENGKTSDAERGGAAINANGGSLKVVNCVFRNNEIASTGPDVAGGAIYATLQYGPVYVVNSTFEQNVGSNGGALGGIFASYHIYNSVLSGNQAIGYGMNPAKSGTPGGGSGGAIYADGNSYALNICGTEITGNSSRELGGAIFYVANDVQGTISIDRSVITGNDSGSPWGPSPGIHKPDCYLQTTVSNISITDSTFE